MGFEDIAIIGISGRFPEAQNLEVFWRNLAASRDSIRELPDSRKKELEFIFGSLSQRFVRNGYLDEIANFDPNYFGISAEEARFMDPQHRISLELVEEAIQSSGYGITKLAESIVSTFVAFNPNRYGIYLKDHPLTVANSLESALAGRIAFSYNFKGPALVIDTACSASMIALHYACMSLITGESNYAIVTGCHLFPIPSNFDQMMDYPIFAKSEKLSAFAKAADGTLGGEGGGALLLKKLSDAQYDNDIVYGVIKGTSVNSDAALSNGFTSPSSVAQTALIKSALQVANVAPDTITYFEAHGTGTELGDPIEVEGISKAYEARTKPLPIGTVKTNIGHLVGMAGFAGIAKAIMSFKYKMIPASLHFDEPNPHIDFENSGVYVNNKLTAVEPSESPMRVSISSFGIIGTNGHAILEEPQHRLDKRDSPVGHFLVPISSNTLEGLIRQVNSTQDFIRDNPKTRIDDIALTLSLGRRHLKYRAAFVASNTADLLIQLKSYSQSGAATALPGELLFLFTPFDNSSTNTSVPAEISQFYNDCQNKISKSGMNERFSIAYAVTQYLISIGIRPKSVLGWGSSRLLANVASGHVTLSDLKKDTDSNSSTDADVPVDKIKNAFARGYRRFCRIGNISTGVSQVEDDVSRDGGVVFSIDDYSFEAILSCVAQMYVYGQSINWERLFQGSTGWKIALPAYVFDKKYCMVGREHLNEFGRAICEPATIVNADIVKIKNFSTSADVHDFLTTLFRRFIPGELSFTASYADNGGDSLSMLDIIDKIKASYGTGIIVDVFYENESLDSLITSISSLIAKNSNSIDKTRQSVITLFERYLPNTLDMSLSFSDNGGDSLAILDVVDQLRKAHSINLSLDVFYETSTIGLLLDFIVDDILHVSSPTSESAPEVTSELAAVDMDTMVVYETQPEYSMSNTHILLTGATGFLGAHCLYELLMTTQNVIHCLVRKKGDIDPAIRLEKTIQRYFGEDVCLMIGSRIIVVPGEITEHNLGVSMEQYQWLTKNILKVLHTAADIRQIAYSKDLENTNVIGVKQLIDFCFDGRRKELHHCSSYVVSGRVRTSGHFREKDLERQQTFLGNAYAQSKYNAELLIQSARERGLLASVYRIGNLTGRFRDGVFQERMQDSLIYAALMAVHEMQCYPVRLANDAIEICPVDQSAKALITLFNEPSAARLTYHLMYPSNTKFSDIFSAMHQSDQHIKSIADEAEFERTYESVVERASNRNILKKFRLFYQPASTSTDSLDTLDPTYDFDMTLATLKRNGFQWPELTPLYFGKMVERILANGAVMVKDVKRPLTKKETV